MQITIISIGSEIVKGQIVNTNAPFIAANLALQGWHISSQIAVLDEKGQIEHHVRQAMQTSDIVILTGGLGPTHDDITREELCRALGIKLVKNTQVFESLACRYGKDANWLENQSLVPENAHVFFNEAGTAPSFSVEQHGKMVIAMPGVPLEMKDVFTKQILPFLQQKKGVQVKGFSTKLAFCCLAESQVAGDLEELLQQFPQVEAGIYPEYGSLFIQLSSKEELLPIKNALIRRFATYYVGENTHLVEAISQDLRRTRQTLVFAESCTGGALSSTLIKYPKASEFLLGSFVVYQNFMKEKFLDIERAMLRSEGAVSSAVARAMAENAREKTEADYAIATTGDLEIPAKIFVACACRGKATQILTLSLKATREVNLLFATNQTLGAFYRLIKHKTAFSVE